MCMNGPCLGFIQVFDGLDLVSRSHVSQKHKCKYCVCVCFVVVVVVFVCCSLNVAWLLQTQL